MWDPESSNFFYRWNPQPWALESGILLTIGIRSPSSTDKVWGIQYLVESGIHGEESRVQDCIPLHLARKSENSGPSNNKTLRHELEVPHPCIKDYLLPSTDLAYYLGLNAFRVTWRPFRFGYVTEMN